MEKAEEKTSQNPEMKHTKSNDDAKPSERLKTRQTIAGNKNPDHSGKERTIFRANRPKTMSVNSCFTEFEVEKCDFEVDPYGTKIYKIPSNHE
jgi:hypothetical protein